MRRGKTINKDFKMKIQESNDEFTELTTCKACRGRGGRYIAVISKKKKKNAEVIFEECAVCEGTGNVEDSRAKEEKLDNRQKETNLWIECKDCDAEGWIIDEFGNELICQTCEGYGVVKDKRTPEEIEKQKFKDGLEKLYWEDDFDFYGDCNEKSKIKKIEEQYVSSKKLEELNSFHIDRILHKIQNLHNVIVWIFIAMAILIITQCNGKTDDKIKEDIKEIRKNIESLDRSIDIINDRTKILDNKWDDIN
ncbi:MAG: hypothetical protein IKJ65_06460 [Clostridia bacterium]|nr:hypothetical protein [Clostridia bacterium]